MAATVTNRNNKTETRGEHVKRNQLRCCLNGFTERLHKIMLVITVAAERGEHVYILYVCFIAVIKNQNFFFFFSGVSFASNVLKS